MANKKSKIEWGQAPRYLVWNRLKSLRRGLGLTVRDVAAGSGVNTALICFIEKGADEVASPATRKKLATYFDVAEGDIFPSLFLGNSPLVRPSETGTRKLKPQPVLVPAQPAADPKPEGGSDV